MTRHILLIMSTLCIGVLVIDAGSQKPNVLETVEDGIYPLDGDGAMSFVNPFFAGFGGRFHGRFPFGAFARSFPAYHVPQMPYPYCQHKGQLLPHPTDRCRYLVCDYGHRSYKDRRGVQLFFAVERSCAPGTAVPKDFLGIVDIYDRKIVSPVWRKAFNKNYLCSEFSRDCSLN